MNGVHDMGGQACHGVIDNAPNEPLFHAEWEKRVLALTLAAGANGMWNLDISRSARESLPPAYYLSAGYYRIWLAALENLLLQAGMIDQQELATGIASSKPLAVKRVLQADQVEVLFANGSPVEREPVTVALFNLGDKVRVKNLQPKTHTRLPAYIRRHCGEVVAVHGSHVYPDSHAVGRGEDPRWLYNIRFDAAELWGDEARRGDSVHVDCWEPYLERV